MRFVFKKDNWQHCGEATEIAWQANLGGYYPIFLPKQETLVWSTLKSLQSQANWGNSVSKFEQRQCCADKSVVQSLSRVWLFGIWWTPAQQASLSFIISRRLLKLMSIESEMSSNHLILYRLLFLLPSIFPRIRVFFSESALHIRWPKFWSFSFSIMMVKHAYKVLIAAFAECMRCKRIHLLSFFFLIYFYFFIFYIVVDFVIHWNETAMCLHVFPIPIPPPTSLSTRSL